MANDNLATDSGQMSDRPLWRPTLTRFSAVLALLALAIALLGPIAEERDARFAQESVVRVEKDVDVMGSKWTLAYPQIEKRSLGERPLTVYFGGLIFLALVGGALCFRSLARGRTNWPAIFGLAAAALALTLAAVLVPVSWMIVAAFIPAIAIVLAAAGMGWAGAVMPEAASLDGSA